jgi:hypothetical protein
MGVHINFLGEMKDEVANTSRPNRSSKIWFFRGPFDDYTTDILLLFFFISSKTHWAIIQRNRKCLKSFLSTRFYFILSCLLDPKGPSTERVEFLYISPTVQPKNFPFL